MLFTCVSFRFGTGIREKRQFSEFELLESEQERGDWEYVDACNPDDTDVHHKRWSLSYHNTARLSRYVFFLYHNMLCYNFFFN